MIEQIYPDSDTLYAKFLGVLIDADLSFKYHINHISSQLSKRLYFLREANFFLPKHCLLSLFCTLILANLTYAIQIWGCSSENLLKPIKTKQKLAVRIIENSRYNAHTEPIFKNLKILPFNSLLLYFQLNFMQEFKQKHAPVAFLHYW